MEPEKVLAVLAIVWLIASFLAMARSIRRLKRSTWYIFRIRLPAETRTHPLASGDHEVRRDLRRTRFSRIVGRREFEQLGDEILAAHFEIYRKNEARIVLSAILSGSVLALLVLALRYFT